MRRNAKGKEKVLIAMFSYRGEERPFCGEKAFEGGDGCVAERGETRAPPRKIPCHSLLIDGCLGEGKEG